MFDANSESEIRDRIAQADNFEDIMTIVIERTSKRHGNAAAQFLTTPGDPNSRFETLRKLSEQDCKIAEYAATRLRQLFTSPRKRPAYRDPGPRPVAIVPCARSEEDEYPH